MPSDRLRLVMWLLTTNQSSLLKHRVVTVHLNLFLKWAPRRLLWVNLVFLYKWANPCCLFFVYFRSFSNKQTIPFFTANKCEKCPSSYSTGILTHDLLLDSRVVFTLDFWTSVHYALGREFESWWRQTLFRTQAQHLCFIHDSIWFDTIICLSNLSCKLWSRKLKIKEIYF